MTETTPQPSEILESERPALPSTSRRWPPQLVITRTRSASGPSQHVDEVESKLSDAARSGQARLAWFTEDGTDGSVVVNPAHVATLKVSEISD
jgi:hypothetical protein